MTRTGSKRKNLDARNLSEPAALQRVRDLPTRFPVSPLICVSLVMTSSQRTIFNKVRAFALENLSVPSSGKVDTKLSMPRTSQAGERAFLTNLVRDSHLSLSWDKEDQNLAVLRFRGVHSGEKDNESNSQGEVEDMTAAVDPASRNYHEAIMMPETIENRSHSKRQQKKDDWKRTYYVVCSFLGFGQPLIIRSA